MKTSALLLSTLKKPLPNLVKSHSHIIMISFKCKIHTWIVFVDFMSSFCFLCQDFNGKRILFSQLCKCLVSDNQWTFCFVHENFFQLFVSPHKVNKRFFKRRILQSKLTWVINFGLLYDCDKKLPYQGWCYHWIVKMANDAWLEIEIKRFLLFCL